MNTCSLHQPRSSLQSRDIPRCILAQLKREMGGLFHYKSTYLVLRLFISCYYQWPHALITSGCVECFVLQFDK